MASFHIVSNAYVKMNKSVLWKANNCYAITINITVVSRLFLNSCVSYFKLLPKCLKMKREQSGIVKICRGKGYRKADVKEQVMWV